MPEVSEPRSLTVNAQAAEVLNMKFRRLRLPRIVAAASLMAVVSITFWLRFDKAPTQTKPYGASAGIQTTEHKISAAPAPPDAQTRVSTSERIPEVFANSDLTAAYAATNAQEALAILDRVDVADPMRTNLIKMIGVTCRTASKPLLASDDTSEGSTAKNHRDSLVGYLASYCGDLRALQAKTDAMLATTAHLSLAHPKRDQDLSTLLEAGVTTTALANAIINEVLTTTDPDKAKNLGVMLSAGLEPGGALVNWNAYLPPQSPRSERIQVVSMAAEMLTCSYAHGCGPNQPIAMFNCVLTQTCQPGEDLLAFRRRTTSPILYRAAEQIAAEMRKRRY
jgi:hypothetical protein